MNGLTDVRFYLDNLDQLVGYALVLFAAVWLVCAVIDRAARHRARVRGPRPESPSETAHRLDAEAARATTRPVHSGRKAGRVPTGGTR